MSVEIVNLLGGPEDGLRVTIPGNDVVRIYHLDAQGKETGASYIYVRNAKGEYVYTRTEKCGPK